MDNMSRADLLNEHADARPATAEEMDSCESAAAMIDALYNALTAWKCDELEECLIRLEQAADEARCAARKLGDELPHGSEYR